MSGNSMETPTVHEDESSIYHPLLKNRYFHHPGSVMRGLFDAGSLK